MNKFIDHVSFDTVKFDPRLDEIGSEFPLTEAQREIWVSAILSEQANAAFNISTHLKITGPLDLGVLRKTAMDLMQRHSALRSRFSDDGTSFRIGRDNVPEWLFVNVPPESDSSAGEVRRQVAEVTESPFDLSAGPLLRIGIVQEAPNLNHVILVVHHLVSDGWSVRILLSELSALYNGGVSGNTVELPAPDSFTQFALRNALIADSPMKSESRDHWLRVLRGINEPARLPPDLPQPPIRSYRADSIVKWLDDDTAAGLRELGRKHNSSLFTTLLALYSVWIGRLSANREVVVGVPVAGQPHFDMRHLVGHCANLLPYRCTIDQTASFENILGEIQAAVADGYEHQVITFGELLKSMSIKRDASLIPLVPVTLNVVSAAEEVTFAECETERVPVTKYFGTFELALDIYRQGDRLQIEAVFNRDLFSRRVMLDWLDSFSTLAKQAVVNPGCIISNMPLIGNSQYQRHQCNMQKSKRDFDLRRSILHTIEETAQIDPGKTAVTSFDGQLNYGQLDQLANQVARYLSQISSPQGKIIGVLLHRSAILPSILLGILKSGAAYLPIDPSFPASRRQFMLEDSGAAVVITQRDLVQELPGSVHAVLVDEERDAIQREDSSSLVNSASPDSRAYVIYTSGSTGRPKGVEISHRNMANFLLAMRETPGFYESDRLLAVTSLSFDISVLELFLPLLCGGSSYIATAAQSADFAALTGLIDRQDISVMQATPSTWRLLVEGGWKGRDKFRALCGGEPMPKELVPQLLSLGCDLWNMYGPTETTVWSTCTHLQDPAAPISIGYPIANTSIYILDENGQLLPPGISGEICIGGSGVAIGYLKRPQLTSEKFIDYISPDGQTERVYRTGDLGYLDGAGKLHHLGRLDFQVKLRGYRIELGEIEARLADHPTIEQAIVDVWKKPGAEPILTAYLRPVDDNKPDLDQIRAYLLEFLPAYMIPQKTEWISQFPLTPNGKVDRKALQPTEVEGISKSATEPELESAKERALADIWKSVIGGARPGRYDNFFEIGGHSLLAVRVLNEIRTRFQVAIPMHMIVLEELRTIADYIDSSAPTHASPVLRWIAERFRRTPKPRTET